MKDKETEFMDYSVEAIKAIIESSGGIASASQFLDAGITRLSLYNCLLSGEISKESHGNYVVTDNQPDLFSMIQNRSDKLIFSHATALYLLGLTDKAPYELDITVPQGDNVSRIKKDYENTKFHYCKKDLWDLGIVDLKTPMGYSVRAYDSERSICDLIRDKNSVDIEIYTKSLKGFFAGNYDSRKIIKYARLFNIESKVRTYMEVM